MKQTAVEWFYQRILAKDIKEVYEQAKAIEKKQIEIAKLEGWKECMEFYKSGNEQINDR